MKRRGLGRGLSELIAGTSSKPAGVREIPTSEIEPNPYQPRGRVRDEEAQELAVSIGEYGILQPLVVREVEPGRYQIIAGERRWRAAQMAGLQTVPCILRQSDDAQTLVLALVENLQREDLNPIEAAKGYCQLMQDFEMTQEEVAQTVGKSRAAVANTVRLLQLPDEVQDLVRAGILSEGHARALLALQGEPDLLVKTAREAAESGIPVREMERIARDLSTSRAQSSTRLTPRPKTSLPSEIEDLRQRVQSALATAVRIRPRRKGGVIEIDYYDDEDLTRIAEALTE